MTTLPQSVFIAGGTGYIGSRLIPRLLAHGHNVRALVRPGSERKLAPGCEPVVGNALDANSYREAIPPATTFVQLVGVAQPSPAKIAEFRSIDVVAGREAVAAALHAGVQHFVYVSVTQPAPMMKAYVAFRTECEEMIRASGLNATILRPWYVLGPGHRWPYLLLPFYWLLEQLPAAREGAQRLGLVTLEQMMGALTNAVDHPSEGQCVLGVPEIRRGTFDTATTAVTA